MLPFSYPGDVDSFYEYFFILKFYLVIILNQNIISRAGGMA
jgi:hypothetical protein